MELRPLLEPGPRPVVPRPMVLPPPPDAADLPVESVSLGHGLAPARSPELLPNAPAVSQPAPSWPPQQGYSILHGSVSLEPPAPGAGMVPGFGPMPPLHWPAPWQPGQLLLQEPLAAPSLPPGRVEVLSNRNPIAQPGFWEDNTWQLFERSEARLRETFPQAERLLIRHEGVNYMVYRVGASGAPDGREGRAIPSCVMPALEKAGKLGSAGRTSRCFSVSNDMVLDGQASHLIAVRPGRSDNLRGVPGVHYVAGMETGRGYAIMDATYPVSEDSQRDQGWPQGVLILADSRRDAMAAASILYGAPAEEEPPELRFR